MTLAGYFLALKVFAIAPLLLVGVPSALYWRTLGKPWLFLLIGSVLLYVLAGIAVFWFLTDVAFTGPDTAGVRVLSVDGTSLPARIAFVFAGFIILGGASLWYLKAHFTRK